MTTTSLRTLTWRRNKQRSHSTMATIGQFGIGLHVLLSAAGQTSFLRKFLLFQNHKEETRSELLPVPKLVACWRGGRQVSWSHGYWHKLPLSSVVKHYLSTVFLFPQRVNKNRLLKAMRSKIWTYRCKRCLKSKWSEHWTNRHLCL